MPCDEFRAEPSRKATAHPMEGNDHLIPSKQTKPSTKKAIEIIAHQKMNDIRLFLIDNMLDRICPFQEVREPSF